MSSVEERTAAFYAWEVEGRGRRTFSYPVVLEPAFRPFPGHLPSAAIAVDDARKDTWLSSLVGRGRDAERRSQAPEGAEPAPEPQPFERTSELDELEILVPLDEKCEPDASRNWLRTIAAQSGQVAFELIASRGRVSIRIAASTRDTARIRDQTPTFFPRVALRRPALLLRELWKGYQPQFTGVAEFVLSREFMVPLSEPGSKQDLFTPLIAALGRAQGDDLVVVQALFQETRSPWAANALAAVTTPHGEPFFDDAPNLTKLAEEKCTDPLYAVVIRAVALGKTREAVEDALMGVSAALEMCGSPTRNAFERVNADDFDVVAQDVLERQTHRSGMILSLSDLSWPVHLPSPAVRSDALLRPSEKTKAAPASAADHEFVLGVNEHDGIEQAVGLTTDQRLHHCYVIGASGTGKSTLLLSMAAQDIASGNGFAVLDPHGDLIDAVLARIPEERAGDVILFDPADEEYPVGFNILSAHSELERQLLSSDLVAVFRRLSTTFGDQMATVLGNAILAFLESSSGGTLLDLRRFLLDKAFRAEFLETVQDPEVVAYWVREFSLLKGLPHAPILTRLNTFLRPKVLRYMVAQKEDRLDIRAIMDGRKILLAKLSQGAVGEENSHLLGSLLMAKIAQAAMSRQNEAASRRVPFFLYVDEFHHFVTPSVASILSGARKYALGLALAHQETRQLKSRSEDVASAVLSNAFTRIVFRVGEQDARAVADGFSFFQAADLQNLGVGEAIARIERRDFDFNLRTNPVPEVDPATAEARAQRVLALSRATYATPRAQIEELLRKSEEAFRSSVASASQDTARSRGARRSAQPAATPAGVPVVPMPGRGGPQHKYLQSLVKRLAEDRGFKVTVEKPVLGGHGHIDVALERDDVTIACEISVTSRVEQEVDNLTKCLAAGFKYAVLISSDDDTLAQARASFSGVDDRQFRFIAPDELLGMLDEIGQAAAEVPHAGRGHRTTAGDSPKTLDESKRTMLIAKDAAKYLGIAQQTLAKMRWAGESPPYFKVGRQVLYDRAELDDWLALRRRRSTSEIGRTPS